MKRIHVYRGKTDAGEWVKGDLVTDGYDFQTAIRDDYIIVRVDPDTVGEYTGITDKNKKVVFEDDIARIKYEGKMYIGLIQYDARGVYIFVARGFGWIPLHKLADSDDIKHCFGQELQAIEVIGNIHDNPELLEQQSDTANNIKEVCIPACGNHEGYKTVKIKLRWVCPICGQPRGTITNVRSYDGSLCLCCDGWENPCGHTDKYAAMRQEAKTNGLNPKYAEAAQGGGND